MACHFSWLVDGTAPNDDKGWAWTIPEKRNDRTTSRNCFIVGRRIKSQFRINRYSKLKKKWHFTTALIGNTPTAFNQVWHLPTDSNTLTIKEIAELAAAAFGVKPTYMVLQRWMLQLTGLFSGIIKESVEMLYQSDSDYLFSSSKFDKPFDFKTTRYSEGSLRRRSRIENK
jgi:hypothetical protein